MSNWICLSLQPLADAEGAKKHNMIELLKSYGGLSYVSIDSVSSPIPYLHMFLGFINDKVKSFCFLRIHLSTLQSARVALRM